MAHVETRASDSDRDTTRLKAPGVLVVLVAKDGTAWLSQCLLGLSRQTHPRLGVLAVDNGSTDGSAEELDAALGAGRVLRLGRNEGYSAALGAALREDMAQQADYVLFLHDDTVLAPESVASLVEAAQRVDGAGVIGPKVLDWDDPRVLRDVGVSTDRFGYPYSPLEDGEVDHGQYDRIRDVRAVSSCAMLVSREVWTRIGPPDPRLGHTAGDLDFCWRAQLAGFQILMAPAAVAVHRGASLRGERGLPGRARYLRERAALTGILKNYGLLSLLWVLPMYVVQGLARLALLALSRRFGDASQVLAAWGWNVIHLPSTLRLRIRAQSARGTPDRVIRRSMAPAGIRLRVWAASGAASLLPRRHGEAEVSQERPRTRLGRLALAHPVATAWGVGIVLALIAYRHLLWAPSLSGGGLAAFPATPTGFFRELVSGLRSTGLGGSQAASPALGMLGVGSVVALDSPALLQKALLLMLPAAATLACYRAVRGVTHERVSAVVAGGAYGLSGLVVGAVSEGRIPVLAFLAGLPWAVTKIGVAFDERPPVRAPRWAIGAGLGVAAIASFYPPVAFAGALALVVTVVTAPARRRLAGMAWTAGATLSAAALAFPVTLSLIGSPSSTLGQRSIEEGFSAMLRMSPDGSAGWASAYAIPVAAALSLLFVGGEFLRPAVRATVLAVAGLYVGWLSAAGYLPAALSHPIGYLAVSAFAQAMLIGLGLATVVPGVARRSFGRLQLGAAAMTAALVVGIGGQAAWAARGDWAVGEGRIPPAYAAVVQNPLGRTGPPSTRVLWLGADDRAPFPAPGGMPQGSVQAGPGSVKYSVTWASGSSALDFGRAAAGPGYRALQQVIREILGGQTRHGGALLAPFGIRYIVVDAGAVGGAALRAIGRQLDLDRAPAEGLLILIDAKAPPAHSIVVGPGWTADAAKGPLDAADLAGSARPLNGDGPRWSGTAPAQPSLVLLSQQFDSHWSLVSGSKREGPERAFGWAIAFPAPRSQEGAFNLRFGGQAARTGEVVALAILWVGALWFTRRPVRHG